MMRHWQVEPLLRQAERLARALPIEDERRVKYLEKIESDLKMVQAMSPFGALAQAFGGAGFFDDDDDDDNDDDDRFF